LRLLRSVRLALRPLITVHISSNGSGNARGAHGCPYSQVHSV